jgi:predicted DNA-binding antitoxin AbrB/MazE fold protein
MKTIHAIYEHGVFRPLDAVDLPDQTEVEFQPTIKSRPEPVPADMKRIYEILSLRFNSGEHDVAARHNEHQP